jgi:hypothetical protein
MVAHGLNERDPPAGTDSGGWTFACCERIAWMRVRLDDPLLISELCDHLSRQGVVCVERGDGEADVLIPGAQSEFEAARMLLAELDLWRAKHGLVSATLEPNPLL